MDHATGIAMVGVVEQLGSVDYAEALAIQRKKVAARKAGVIPDTLLLLEHPHVYTLGRNANREHLLVPEDQLARLGARVFETDRGGDITYHGPGQLVGYPIMDLTRHRRDISWYMRSLEEVFIQVAGEFGIRAERIRGAPGVWIGDDKLVAMGVRVSRWITSHGFAFNINTDLSYFEVIIPCGLRDKGVTSLSRILGRQVAIETATQLVIDKFAHVFGLEIDQAATSPKNKARVQV